MVSGAAPDPESSAVVARVGVVVVVDLVVGDVVVVIDVAFVVVVVCYPVKTQ